jgi:hypothetical protein
VPGGPYRHMLAVGYPCDDGAVLEEKMTEMPAPVSQRHAFRKGLDSLGNAVFCLGQAHTENLGRFSLDLAFGHGTVRMGGATRPTIKKP